MKRPIIKGTPLHKASIAKARSESIVSQSRTQADSSLVGAGQALGKSYIPAAIDFTKDRPNTEQEEAEPKTTNTTNTTNTPRTSRTTKTTKTTKTAKTTEGDELEKIKVEDPTGVLEATLEGTTKQAVEGTGSKTEAGKGYVQPKKKKSKIRVMTPEELNSKKSEEKEVTKIEPRSIKKLPNNKKKLELQKATGTVQTKKSVDKFDAAAEKAGIPITTVEEYKRAERLLLYDEATGNWREKTATAKPTGVIVGEAGDFTGDSGSSDDQYKAMQKAGLDYGIGGLDMRSDGKGGYVPKEGAVSESGDSWDAKLGGWRDDAEEQNYGPKGQKISKKTAGKVSDQQQRKSDKIKEEKEKKSVREADNVKIRERNKNKADARKFYNTEKLTKKQLKDYNETMRIQKARENEPEIEIVEESGPEPQVEEYNRIKALNSNTPKQQPSTTTTKPVVEKTTTTPDRKPRPGDFEGTWKEKQTQYKIANEKWYQSQQAKKGKSPVETRDDRIYRNAKQDGPVRKNMIKGGYTPKN